MTIVATRLAVIGVGLIGGSLARAVRDAGLAGEVVGWSRRPESRRIAIDQGLVDRVADMPEDAAEGADLVVVAARLSACAGLAARVSKTAAVGAVLTDVGSVKARQLAALEAAWPAPSLVVGAHPVAGSERSGAAAADPELFRRSHCVLTPSPHTNPEALARVRALWRGVGATVDEMSPEQHDAVLARVSHAPHVLAYALVRAVQRARVAEDVLGYAGAGFRDTTRIAASSPALWREIVLENAEAVLEALGEFDVEVRALRDAIENRDGETLEHLASLAATHRSRLDEEPE